MSSPKQAGKLILAVAFPWMLPLNVTATQNPWQSQHGQPNKRSGEAAEKEDDQQEGEGEEEANGSSWRDHFYWADGLYLDTTWNNLRIKFGGDVQNDSAGFANEDDDHWSLRRLRG